MSIFFSFQSCRNVQFSFNFGSFVKLSFQQNFRVEFSLSCLTWYNFNCLILLLFLGKLLACVKYLSAVQEPSDETLLLAIFPAFCLVPESYFRLILVLFLGKLLACLKYLSAIQEQNDKTLLQAIFFVPLQLVHEFVLRVPIVVLVGGSFLVPYCPGLLLPFPLWPIQVPHVVGLIFFLERNFYTVHFLLNVPVIKPRQRG